MNNNLKLTKIQYDAIHLPVSITISLIINKPRQKGLDIIITLSGNYVEIQITSEKNSVNKYHCMYPIIINDQVNSEKENNIKMHHEHS